MLIDLTQENFENHWGYPDFKDKVILDLGADMGSTAKCFLAYGAKKAICVEGDSGLFETLKKTHPDAELCFIDSEEKMKSLLTKYDADIVKIDIEHGEKWLLPQTDELIGKFKEWLIEWHTGILRDEIEKKFIKAGFSVVKKFGWTTEIGVTYMVKK